MPPVYQPQNLVAYPKNAGVVDFGGAINSALDAFVKVQEIKFNAEKLKQQSALTALSIENARIDKQISLMQLQMQKEEFESGSWRAKRQLEKAQYERELKELQIKPQADQMILDMKGAISSGDIGAYSVLKKTFTDDIAASLGTMSDYYLDKITKMESTPIEVSDYITDQAVLADPNASPFNAVKRQVETMSIRDAMTQHISRGDPLTEAALERYQRFVRERAVNGITKDAFDMREALNEEANAMSLDADKLQLAAMKAARETSAIYASTIGGTTSDVALDTLFEAQAAAGQWDVTDVLDVNDKKIALVSTAFAGFANEIEKQAASPLVGREKSQRMKQQAEKLRSMGKSYNEIAKLQVTPKEGATALALSTNPFTAPLAVGYAGYAGLKRILPGLRMALEDPTVKANLKAVDDVANNYILSKGDARLKAGDEFNTVMARFLVSAWGNSSAYDAAAKQAQADALRKQARSYTPRVAVYVDKDGIPQATTTE